MMIMKEKTIHTLPGEMNPQEESNEMLESLLNLSRLETGFIEDRLKAEEELVNLVKQVQSIHFKANYNTAAVYLRYADIAIPKWIILLHPSSVMPEMIRLTMGYRVMIKIHLGESDWYDIVDYDDPADNPEERYWINHSFTIDQLKALVVALPGAIKRLVEECIKLNTI